jgi:hypothetical protein
MGIAVTNTDSSVETGQAEYLPRVRNNFLENPYSPQDFQSVNAEEVHGD